MKIKNRVLLLIVLCLLFLAGTAAGASSSVVKNISATIYPNLTLYFKGEKELPSTERPGYYWTGSEWVPKAMIYNGTTYVPLRYFATKMGIPNEQIGWDPATPSIWVGSEKPAELNQKPVVSVPAETTNGVGLFGVALGYNQEQVKQVLGEPSRIDYGSSGQFWSYTSDYANYALMYFQNNSVTSIYSTAKNWKYRDLVNGMAIGDRGAGYSEDIKNVVIPGFNNSKDGDFFNKSENISISLSQYNGNAFEILISKIGGGAFSDRSGQRQQLFDMINGIRVAQNVEALSWNENAALIAQAHSEDLQSHPGCGHDSSNGDTIAKRKQNAMSLYGFTFGENVVCDSSLISSVSQWVHSPGHLKNILNPSYKSTGIGILIGSFTQVFV